jgi:hypothetical protein
MLVSQDVLLFLSVAGQYEKTSIFEYSVAHKKGYSLASKYEKKPQ